MDDLSNRDLSQVSDEELTPAERAELRRRLDRFVEVMRDRVIEGRRLNPGPKPDDGSDPAGRGGAR